MMINKNYLSYLFRSRKVFLIFYYILFLALSLASFLMDTPGRDNLSSVYNSLFIATLGSCLLALGLPLLQFSFAHKRKSADIYFALPMKRKEQLFTNLLFIWLASYLFYLMNAALSMALYNNFVPIGSEKVLLLLLVPVFALLLLTICSSAWFLVANNIFDGFVMVAAYSFMPLFLSILLGIFFDSYVAGSPLAMVSVVTFVSPIMFVLNIF